VNPRAAELERRLEWPLLLFALLTIPVIVLEQSDVSGSWDALAGALNWMIWLAFLAEIVLMLRVVDDRSRWLREHPLDVAIVVFTPPFLPAALQAARSFRLLRLVRLVKLTVLTRRMLSTEGVRDAAVLALLAILAGGAAFAAVEKTDADGQAISAWDGVWWAITTVTTVGYGDLAPRTDGGRAIAIVVMLVGIGFVAILTAAAAERFMRSRQEAAEERAELNERLDEILRRLATLERRK
jgi:voltage-gated potassium channel